MAAGPVESVAAAAVVVVMTALALGVAVLAVAAGVVVVIVTVAPSYHARQRWLCSGSGACGVCNGGGCGACAHQRGSRR